ncbi:MAG: hypothetical protein HYX69_23000 [Planctomycetia bacterium]|nr:hypothetical protein [Planctomycetia bacterium]
MPDQCEANNPGPETGRRDSKPRRRWFQFGLGTMFLAVTACAIAAYWLHLRAAREQARSEWDRTYSAFQTYAATAKDACEASLRLFRAEAAVPFADRRKAAASHLERVEQVRNFAYGPASEWMMGVSDEPSLAEAKARKAEIDAYDEAARMAADAR